MVTEKEERRQWPREALPFSEIGIVHPKYDPDGQDGASEDKRDTWLVHIRDRSEGGLLLEAPLSFGIGSLLDMRMRLVHEDVWQAIRGEVVWARQTPDSNKCCFLGVRLHPETRETLPRDMEQAGKKRMCPADLEFFRGTQLFDAISEEAKCPLLNRMTPEYVEPGKRFITQGEPGDAFYVIQEGSCVVSVEKDGSEHPLSRLRAGDIAGEIALITDWPRSAHIDAETKVKLWGITKAQFDEVCEECGDIRNFLTELVARRLSRESVTADRTVGKYVINEIIGLGGWGVVYRGIHKDLDMPVAIKMLKHDMAMDPDFSKKFRYEAKTIAHLNHENIIRVYDIEELYRTIFIIMEYLRGLPLDYILEKMDKLPASRVVDILLQVCAGLDYAHKQGIVHQDIKPPNLFVQPNDQVKIVDFGLACSPGDIDSSLRGTIFYAPPELIEGDSVNEQTDIYCLGITAFEMITGQRPYPEDDINKMIDMRLREDIPDPRAFVPDLPEELCGFVIRSTQRDPNARYKSISEAMHDLRPLVKKLGVKREPRLEEQRKMMSLFLFYPNQQELLLKRLVEGFSSELNKLGAELRTTEFRDVSR
ncbi:MAG: protein kinase [Desulfobacteria bacterium]